MSTIPRPYLPVRLIDRLERAAQPAEGEPLAVATAGVVLFVDISGFTTLTDRLSETKGGAGIDQLARVLNDTFARIVERIEARGGEVVTFAGDAVVAWWEAGGPPAQAATLQQAALEQAALQHAALHHAMACARIIDADVSAAIEGITVRVRQVVAVGALRAVRVGAAPYAVLLDGEALAQLSEAPRRPPGGPAVLTPAAHRLAGRVPAGPEAANAPPPVVPALRLDRYVDPLLRAWTEDPDRAPELRALTTMFIRLDEAGLTLHALHQIVMAAQRELTRHRGAVVSVCRDDKGVVIVAAFGLPSREVFHPADPGRAAVALTAAITALGATAGVGLATGRTCFGAAPLGDRRRFQVIGSPMNLAARLMMLGDGVWCDSSTARGARGAVRTAEPRSLRFKGFAAPVTAWRLFAVSGEPADGDCVGRRAALAVLDAAMGRLRAGAGGWVQLTGEPGIGKSAVLQEVRRRARAAGMEVLALGGGTVDTPFAAWAPALRVVLGAREDIGRALVAALGEDAELAPLLAPMLGIVQPETAESSALRGFVRAARMVELLVGLITPRRGSPARVVVVEEGHALDERSRELLERVVGRGLLVVLATRSALADPDGMGVPLPAIAGAVERIHLGPLDPGEVTELVRACLGGASVAGELPPGLLDWLLARAHGHPHFTRELLSLAQERGYLELDPAGRFAYFDRAGLEATSPPDTVQAALVARLDLLPSAGVVALKAASAIGVVVPRSVLARLVPEDLDSAVEPLVDAGWLVPTGDGFRFARPTAREAVHALLVRAERRRLHGAIVAFVEPDTLDPAVLADHLAHAGALSAAILQLDAAWSRAMAGGLPRAAADIALRALSLDGEAGELGEARMSTLDRAGWHRRVAVACRGFGDTHLAITHLDAAAEGLALRLPGSLGAWRLRLLAELVRHGAERVLPLRRRPGDALRASVLNLLSLTAYLRSKPAEQLLATALWAVRLGWRRPEVGPEPAPTTALASSMLTIATSGIVGLADAYGREGQRRARLHADPQEEVDAALGRLMLHLAHGRWDDIEALVVTLLPQVRASRADTLHAAFLGLFAVGDYFTGRMERCAARCGEMVILAERESYLQARGWARNLEASLALLAGDLDGARRCADEAQAILERRREPDHLTPRALRAQIALRAGALDVACAEIAALEPLLAAELVSVTGLEAYATPVEVHLAAALSGDRSALARVDRSFRSLRAYTRQFPVGVPRLLTLEAVRLQAAGRPSAARFAEAAEAAQRRRMPLETLRVLEYTGEDTSALRGQLARGWPAASGALTR